ncbi:transmembrane protein 154-like [Hypanus sabinus]|uniref:transmembrane protein 154-like n=1 Tax=Hypanus sabinus TaxID=79690 RepID=UPI0028C3D8F2|nr:transmembrane protein 154-like [Hypanus sabinus]
MNQQNSRLCLMVTVVLLFSGKGYSLRKTETATPVTHTNQSAENATDVFVPSYATFTHHGLHTKSPTSQPRKAMSTTISHNSSASMILEDAHEGNIANANTKANELLKGTRNSTYELMASLPSENTLQPLAKNKKLIGMILLPILILFLLGLIIAILLNCYRGKKRIKDEVNCESPASPIFEEDVASVMEVEMEEVSKWMGSMKEKSQQGNSVDTSKEKN